MEKRIKILLVEDEVIAAMYLQYQLKSVGYNELCHVTTGKEAIISAREKQPDVILMDIRLADDIDGIEAATKIKLESDIPIIFLTGYDDDIVRERAEKLKPLEYLIKPYEVKTIKKIIDAHFGLSSNVVF